MRWYLGCKYDPHLAEYRFKAFQAAEEPTRETTGYLYCVGPFDTKRGAMWAEKYGKRNPHFTCVDDAPCGCSRSAVRWPVRTIYPDPPPGFRVDEPWSDGRYRIVWRGTVLDSRLTEARAHARAWELHWQRLSRRRDTLARIAID